MARAEENTIKTPLRVAMIGHKTIPGRDSGVEIVVEELSKRLVWRGVAVDALNRSRKDGNSLKTWEGVRLITIPTVDRKSLDAPVYAFFATLRACFGRYDLLHYHAEGPCIMLWLCRLLGKKTVVTIHGLDWQRAKWGGLATKVLLFGERCAAKYAGEVIVLSHNVQAYFREKYGRETVYIPNGVNEAELCTDAPVAGRYGLKPRGYILYVGRIVPEKGLDRLVEAYRQTKTDTVLVIAGGSSHTDGYEKELREKARDDARIVFTGHVEGDDLRYLFSNAYFYVLPSDMEGMPISLLEAMSYGNCCLVSDIEENTEVLAEAGLTFRKGNIESLKEKIKGLLGDAGTVQRYRELARDRARNYTWDSVVEQTVRIYKDITGWEQ